MIKVASAAKSTAVQTFSVLLALFCVPGLGTVWAQQGQAIQTEEAAAPERSALLVTLQLPLQGNADRLFRGKLQRAVDRLTASVSEGGLQLQGEAQQKRPLLVIQFVPSSEGQSSEFERAVGLARFLTSESMAGVKTLAYLNSSIEGHAVLVALACEEIAMAPDVEIGRAASDESPSKPIEPAIKAMYEQIALSRRTAPTAIVLGMVDRRAEVLQVETDRGIEFVVADELPEIEEERVLIGTEVLSPSGEMASFTGREARELGFVRYLASDNEALARTLGVPPDRLLEDQSLTEPWRPIIIDLDGPMTNKQARRVQTLLGSEIEKGANWIGFRIETSGGDWAAALSLSRTISELADGEARTVAYVPRKAEGPGALVALACDQLVMQKDSKLTGATDEDFVENKNQALELIELDQEDQAEEEAADKEAEEPEAEAEEPAKDKKPGLQLGKGAKPNQEKPKAEVDRKAIEQLVDTIRDSLADETNRSWSLLAAAVDPELELARYSNRVTGAQRFMSPDELSEQPRAGEWERLEAVKEAGQPLELSSARATELRIAWQEIEQFDDLAVLYGFSEPPITAKPNWALELVEALASPGFAALLLVIGIVGIYIELSSPGLGLGGFVATVAFLLFFWSKFLDGTADWLEVMLFVAGIVFILIELVILPGFGIFGLGGMLMVVAALVLASQTFVFPKTAVQMTELRNSLSVVAGSGLVFVVVAMVLRQYLPQSPLFKRMMLHPPEEADLIEQQQREALAHYEHLVGATGSAITDLLPGGRAEIQGEIIDVVTDGEVIDRGESIQVVSAQANRVLVKRV